MIPTDALTSKLVEIINQIQNGVVAHAPDAMNLILLSTRIDGILMLILAILPILVFFTIGHKIRKYGKKLKLENIKEYEEIEDEITIFSLFFIYGSFAPIIIFSFISPWTYIQVFSPKLYIAHEIIQKVMQ